MKCSEEFRTLLAAANAEDQNWPLQQRSRAGIDLERRGRSLAAMDLLIASHALSEGCALVSADQAFASVSELTLETW